MLPAPLRYWLLKGLAEQLICEPVQIAGDSGVIWMVSVVECRQVLTDVIAVPVCKCLWNPVRPARLNLIDEDRGNRSPELASVPSSVSLVCQLDEGLHRFGIQDIDKVVPVLVAPNLYLAGCADLDRPGGSVTSRTGVGSLAKYRFLLYAVSPVST